MNVRNAVMRLLQRIPAPQLRFSIRIGPLGFPNRMNRKWAYFEESEVSDLDVELVAKLDMARSKAGVPFVITSGRRTPEQNERVLGVDASAHITGKAVDLRCHDSSVRYKMVKALLDAGFNRVGIYDKHLHVDIDDSKDQNVIWIGVSH